MSQNHDEHGGISTSKYMIGFFLAVVLTLLSFIPVMKDMLVEWTIRGKIIYLIGLALIQIFVQVVFFLHLNHGPNARWNVITFIFAVICAFIVIAGTWSAMQYLNYNMMGGSGRIVTPARKVILPPSPKTDPITAPLPVTDNGQKKSTVLLPESPKTDPSTAAPLPVVQQVKKDVKNAVSAAADGLKKINTNIDGMKKQIGQAVPKAAQ